MEPIVLNVYDLSIYVSIIVRNTLFIIYGQTTIFLKPVSPLQITRYWFFIVCLEPHYGIDCNNRCGQCLGDNVCNNVTGQCLRGCKQNWNGSRCDGKQQQTKELSFTTK